MIEISDTLDSWKTNTEYIFKYMSETNWTLEKTEDVYGSHCGVITPVVSNWNREWQVYSGNNSVISWDTEMVYELIVILVNNYINRGRKSSLR